MLIIYKESFIYIKGKDIENNHNYYQVLHRIS